MEWGVKVWCKGWFVLQKCGCCVGVGWGGNGGGRRKGGQVGPRTIEKEESERKRKLSQVNK